MCNFEGTLALVYYIAGYVASWLQTALPNAALMFIIYTIMHAHTQMALRETTKELDM